MSVAPRPASRSTAATSPTPSTCPCTRWPPSRVAQRHRPLEVHRVARRASRRRLVRVQRLRRRGRTPERVVGALDHREAHAVHGDRRPDRRCRSDDESGSRRRAARPSSARTAPALLNDPGEHRPPPAGRRRPARPSTDVERAAPSPIGATPSPPRTPGRGGAADQLGRHVQHDPVDERRPHDAPRERRAALEQHALHVALAERAQQARQRHAAGPRRRRAPATSAPAAAHAARALAGARSVVATSVGRRAVEHPPRRPARGRRASTTTRSGGRASVRRGRGP